MKRFRFVLIFLFLAFSAFADTKWEALIDETGAVSMVHVPGRDEWIELVNEPDGSFHTYTFREIARTYWYIITEDPSRALLFWIPRRSPVRILFVQDSGQPVAWGGPFHLEWRDWPSLPRDPAALGASGPEVWMNAGIDIGRDYANRLELREEQVTS